MIPSELTRLQCWVAWMYKKMPGGKMTKIPLTTAGHLADTTDPTTWASYEKARASEKIGFVFQRENGIVGIDLDHVIDSSTILPWAECLIEECSSYTEVSPSGLGVHIIAKGNKPRWMHSRYDKGQSGIEVYDSARFFTVTGMVFRDYFQMREINLDKVFDFLKPGDVELEEGRKKTYSGKSMNISVHDVISGFKEQENTAHPFHDSTTGANFRIDKGGETWRCWRHGFTHNALHLIGQKAGIVQCGDKPSKDQWKKILQNAKELGLIGATEDKEIRNEVMEWIRKHGY